jgi:hypothetical protein
MPFYGSAVLCADDLHVRVHALRLRPIITRVREDAAIRATDMVLGARWFTALANYRRSPSRSITGSAQRVSTRSPGSPWRPDQRSAKAIQRAGGIPRRRARFQQFGEVRINGALNFSLVDDYGTTGRLRPLWKLRASHFQGGASCSRFSRTATRVRATCSRNS